jgi:transcriptional regulator with XRE-family HTH domain
MPDPRELQPVPPELRELLTRLREQAGLTQTALARACGWSQAKVAKIEKGGIKRPAVADVRAIVQAAGGSQEDLARAADLAGQVAVQARSYRSSTAGGLAERQAEILRVERDAPVIRNFHIGVIPGMLQTAGYAREVFQLANIAGRADIPAAVAARMERQSLLYDPARQWQFILHENALRWHPGGPEMMTAQADRILSVATLSNVTIRVIPLAAPIRAMVLSGFIIYDIADEPMVLVELRTGDAEIYEPDEVGVYSALHDQLTSEAVSGAEAAAIIRGTV